MPDYRPLFYSKYKTILEEKSQEYDLGAINQLRMRWQEHLPKDKNAHILDIGCGEGYFLRMLKQSGYGTLSGVDLDNAQVEQAKAAGLESVFCQDALSYLAGAQSKYDLICAFNFFEHLTKEEVLTLLQSVSDALRPGGKLLALTPNGLSPFSGSTRYWDFSHELSYTPSSWRQLSKWAGFSAVEFEEFGPMRFTLIGKARSIGWTFIRLIIDGISYIEVARCRDSSRCYTADMKIILTR